MGMWFEGETTPAQFALVLRDCLLTPDPSLPTPAPLWQMVSSNIGTSLTDNGYLFYSQGSSGKDNIYIGVKNAYIGGISTWRYGHKFFICESYVPGGAGVNGVISNEIGEGLRYHNDESTGGVPDNTLRMKYGISITKDRVIIVIRSLFPGLFMTRSMLYMGLIKRYSDEIDSTGSAIASTHGYVSNTYNAVRLLRDGAKNPAAVYQVANNEETQLTYNGWGRRFMASNIPLTIAGEGVRGELDGLLTVRYDNLTTRSGRNVPEDGTVLINGKKYMCILKPYYQHNTHDNFAHAATDYAYFIPKE